MNSKDYLPLELSKKLVKYVPDYCGDWWSNEDGWWHIEETTGNYLSVNEIEHCPALNLAQALELLPNLIDGYMFGFNKTIKEPRHWIQAPFEFKNGDDAIFTGEDLLTATSKCLDWLDKEGLLK